MATVFYSWQRDLPNNTNRNLIQVALEKATKAIREDGTIAVDPQIDRDTSGVAGSPDIAATIFEKIEAAAVVVADVSLVNQEGKRQTPNPNVLLELGYAAKAVGWNRILTVFNTATGRVEDLPFDLRSKRTITYRADPEGGKAEARKELAKQLEVALRTILADHEAMGVGDASPATLAREALVADARNQTAQVKKFISWAAEQLDEMRPGLRDDEDLVRSLEQSIDVVSEFAEIAIFVADLRATEAEMALYKGLEPVLAGYGSAVSDPDHDLHRFVGHELLCCLVAPLLKQERWEELKAVLEADLLLNNNRRQGPVSFRRLSVHTPLLEHRVDRLNLGRTSLRADMLKERHSAGRLGDLCPFADLVEADYFLYLRSVCSEQDDGFWSAVWRPWSVVYMEQLPEFILRAVSEKYARGLCVGLGLTRVDELRQVYAEHGQSAAKLYRERQPFLEVPVQHARLLGSQ